MQHNIKFTIVIPTRERADVLEASLRTAVMQDYDNLEIIVSDNFSNDHTEDVVKSFKDPRIKYLNTGKRISMSHNWEFALSHVSDGWVTILGDDDGLLPGAINRVSELANHFSVDVIRSSICSYLWPSISETNHGKLTMSLRKGHNLRDSQYWLSRALHGSTSTTSLPMLYTGGFVNSQLVHRVRDKAGTFYKSMIPDVFSAMAFSRLTKQFLFVHEPLAVGGASKHSNGASSFVISKGKNIEQAPIFKFMSEPNMPFHHELPTLPDGAHLNLNSVLVLESFLQTQHLASARTPPLSADRMLEIVIRAAKRSQLNDTWRWANLFAEQHKISVGKAKARAMRFKLFDKLVKHTDKQQQKFHSITINGTRDLPIRDVYEASIVASTTKHINLGKFAKFI